MNVIDAIQIGTKGMDGNKTAQSSSLRISSQRIDELRGLKESERVVVVVRRYEYLKMEVWRRIQANANQTRTWT